jgi:diguanylate cyclase
VIEALARLDALGVLLGLVGAMGLVALVEGVETAAEAEQLRAYGADLAQGYHFARPLDADAVAPLLNWSAR